MLGGIRIHAYDNNSNNVRITTYDGKHINYIKSCKIEAGLDRLITAQLEVIPEFLDVHIPAAGVGIANLDELSAFFGQLGYRLVKIQEVES